MWNIDKKTVFVATVFCMFAFVLYAKPTFARKKFDYSEEKEVSHTMRMLQMNTENLHIAFDKKDWDQMGKLALEIHDACGRLETRGDMDVPVEFDDFRIHSENLHDYAEALVDASKKNDIDAAKKAYKKMEKTCVGCHKIFR